ncbi:response regulator transcription factor [Actibacterium ureilyticum]|uniref:response regulator transcription factor n=1 Tax=Actibacterium ureilyticum TaxID=1590614 RepID=UPI000BAAA90F|nr:response regulator transcription factor [Actibacterium ureilyticum]
MTTAPRILIVDDDAEITSVLSRALALDGYDTVIAHRIDDALQRFRAGDLAAAIVDVMIGSDSGLDLVRRVRAEGNATPILMLSALAEVADRAAGLEAGANDYVVKPFSFDELLARLKVQLSRPQKPRTRLERARWAVVAPGREVVLTQREFALLSALAAQPGQVHARADLFQTLWAGAGASSENVVDVYVGYLRRKLDPMSDFGFQIKTLRNRGFQLDGTPPVLD